MRKVLAIAPYAYLPYFSGGQKFIARFVEWLGKEVELTVISVEGNDFSMAGTYKGLPLLKKSRSRYFDRSLVSTISNLVKKESFDTIICEHPYYAWLVFAIRKRTGIRVIIHTHNIEFQRFRSAGKWWWPLLRCYEKKSFQKADALLFISPEDREFAIKKWKVPEQKCINIPYGIETNSPPADKTGSGNYLRSRFGIAEDEKILLFAGQLNYGPNEKAVNIILNEIYPKLKNKGTNKFRIIICGKSLAGKFSKEVNLALEISYAGFVEDIDTYFKGADIFLNPVMSGGGVKTKIIEALAAGTTVISTQTGAIGMNRDVCGDKLIIVKDNDWPEFSKQIGDLQIINTKTPPAFYNHYFYGNIIKRLIEII